MQLQPPPLHILRLRSDRHVLRFSPAGNNDCCLFLRNMRIGIMNEHKKRWVGKTRRKGEVVFMGNYFETSCVNSKAPHSSEWNQFCQICFCEREESFAGDDVGEGSVFCCQGAWLIKMLPLLVPAVLREGIGSRRSRNGVQRQFCGSVSLFVVFCVLSVECVEMSTVRILTM